MVPSRRQIEQQVSAVLERASEASVVGIHASRPGHWPESIRVGAREFRLAWCESPLAAREALVDKTDEAGLVLLTAADDTTLGADLLARLWRGRVFHLQSWDLVRDLFKAREIDPRLAPMGWIADLLVEQAPPGGYAPAPGGFLSADLAWQQVLAVCLGLGEGRPDAITLLEWSLREDASVRFGCLAPAARADLAGWLLRTAGPAARPILACVAAGQGAEVLPIGLVCELIFRDGSDRDPVRSAAAARLERYTDGQRVDPVAGRRWGEAAAAVLARLGGGVDSTLDPLAGGAGVVTRWEQGADDGAFAARGFAAEAAPTGGLAARGLRLQALSRAGGWGEWKALRRMLLAQADRILDELGLTALAESSDLLQAGLDARLGRYAEALTAALADLERSAPERSSPKQSTQQASTLERAEAAAERVLAHWQTATWPLRRERLRMSLRLLRWLARPGPVVGDFATAAESYAGDGAFVDWARMTLLGGEELADLSAAYSSRARHPPRRHPSRPGWTHC